MADEHLQRLDHVERRVDRNESRVNAAFELHSAAMQEISGALKELSLVAHEQIAISRELGRAFTEMDKIKEEVKTNGADIVDIKIAMPGLKQTSGWVVGGVIGIVCLVGLAVAAFIFRAPQ